MSFHDVYIGLLERPSRWPRKPPSAEGAPRRASPFFPPSRQSPYFELKRRIATGDYKGEQVDWGAWVARVSKGQLQAFVAEMYDHDPTYKPGSPLPHLNRQLVELREYVDALEEGEYPLVACELMN